MWRKEGRLAASWMNSLIRACGDARQEVWPYRIVGVDWGHGTPISDHESWATFLRSQAHAILTYDFLTATTLSGATLFFAAPRASSSPTRTRSWKQWVQTCGREAMNRS